MANQSEQHILKQVEIELLGSLKLFINNLKEAESESQKSVKNIQSGFKGLVSEVANLKSQTTQFTSALKSAVVGVGLVFGASQIVSFFKDTMMYAGRVEVLEVVSRNVGKTAGYTAQQVKEVVKAVEALNITTMQANLSVTKFVQAGLGLDQVAKVARVAQDAAVVMGFSSQQALEGLVHGIITLQPEVLRTYGIITNLEVAYRRYARQHQMSYDDMAQSTKQQIALNEVLRVGARLQGTYEAAMTKAQKQMLSLQRVWEQFKLTLGKELQDAFYTIVMGLQRFLKTAGDTSQLHNTFKLIGNAIQNIAIGLFKLGDWAVKHQKLLTAAFNFYILQKFAMWMTVATARMAQFFTTIVAGGAGIVGFKVALTALVGLLTIIGADALVNLPTSLKVLMVAFGLVTVAIKAMGTTAAWSWKQVAGPIGWAVALLGAVGLFQSSMRSVTDDTQEAADKTRELDAEALRLRQDFISNKERAIQLAASFRELMSTTGDTKETHEELVQTLQDLHALAPDLNLDFEDLTKNLKILAGATEDWSLELGVVKSFQLGKDTDKLVKDLDGVKSSLGDVGKALSGDWLLASNINRELGGSFEKFYASLNRADALKLRENYSLFMEALSGNEPERAIELQKLLAKQILEVNAANQKSAQGIFDKDSQKLLTDEEKTNLKEGAQLAREFGNALDIKTRSAAQAALQIKKNNELVAQYAKGFKPKDLAKPEDLLPGQDFFARAAGMARDAESKYFDVLKRMNKGTVEAAMYDLKGYMAEWKQFENMVMIPKRKGQPSIFSAWSKESQDLFNKTKEMMKSGGEFERAVTGQIDRDEQQRISDALEKRLKLGARGDEEQLKQLRAFYAEKVALGKGATDEELENYYEYLNRLNDTNEQISSLHIKRAEKMYQADKDSYYKSSQLLSDAGKEVERDFGKDSAQYADYLSKKKAMDEDYAKYKIERWKMDNPVLSIVLTQGLEIYDNFMDSLVNLEITGKKRREQIWKSFIVSVERMFAEMLKRLMLQQLFSGLLNAILPGAGLGLLGFTGGGGILSLPGGGGIGGVIGNEFQRSINTVGRTRNELYGVGMLRELQALNENLIYAVSMKPAIIFENRVTNEGLYTAAKVGENTRRGQRL